MLENWLHPLHPDQILEDELADYQFGQRIQFFNGETPDLRATRLALVGMDAKGANAVRRALYTLSFPFEGLNIADLGNVRRQEVAFVIPLIRELLDSQIFPVLLGADPVFCQAQYKAFKSLKELINLVVIDERIPLNERREEDPGCYLNDILLNRRSRLFHLGVIGYQAHFTPPEALQWMEKRNFECIRLGKAQADLPELEPVIRDADLLSINLSALKQAEAPGQYLPSPSGFYLEEACQICRYGGMSDKLRALGLFGYSPDRDKDQMTAQALAQMIWYFIDGFYNRKNDFPVSNEGLVEYIVEFKDDDMTITFWKSNRSGRWWIQVPVKTNKKYQRHRLIPCSYNDYKMACQEEMPDRLLNAFKRFE